MGIMIARGVGGRAFIAGATVCAVLVLMNVLMMRWNVVIGGQEISKTTRGLLTYPMHIVGRESLVSAAAVTLAPLGLLWIVTRLFPPWHEQVRPRG
jgi:predicted membrane protein